MSHADEARAVSQPSGDVPVLKGNDHIDDSLSMAIVAASGMLGVEGVDYERVYCRSTNAFAPAISTGEDCTSHWHCEAWLATRTMDHLAAATGLKAEQLDIELSFDHAWSDERKDEARRLIALRVREAMDAGAVVLTTGGWDIGLEQVDGRWVPVGPHGFVFWGAAGIVTRADPVTGEIRGAHPNGYDDNLVLYPAMMWALSVAQPGSDHTGSDRQTLRLAIERVRSEGSFASDGVAVFGLEAMDVWIRQMAEVKGFCPGCFDRSPDRAWTDAYDNARRTHKAAQVTAGYLHALSSDFHPAGRGDLESAAKHYDRIAELLAPYVTDGENHYKHWVGSGDMSKQQAHAREQLTAVRAELRAAADDMESALSAE